MSKKKKPITITLPHAPAEGSVITITNQSDNNVAINSLGAVDSGNVLISNGTGVSWQAVNIADCSGVLTFDNGCYETTFNGFHSNLKDPHIITSLFTFFEQQFIWNYSKKQLPRDLDHPFFHAVLEWQKKYDENAYKQSPNILRIGEPSIQDAEVMYKKLEKFLLDNGISSLKEIDDALLTYIKLTVLKI